ncbi:MAG: uncharacterized protein QOD50_2337 [Actinomycetota bacterium]|jgi:uncharacterized protein YyaL (SSP411 family)|nr:uncharacterized protein [Actinomycetota bacterium]
MPNRLGSAVSPYLRSHADNPVDWYPWGPEAFAEAVRRDVPVLISIGYSTCHWCHVMARESFSDANLAAQLNANFVSIKVDREEYPDVDASYLAAASAFTDQLGWPLTIFATPTGRAFYAGTYFPPTPSNGLPSFREVLDAMADAWRDQRDNVEDTAGRLAAALTSERAAERGALPGAAEFEKVVGELLDYEDTEFGGFGGAPKFPVAPVVDFLQGRALIDPRAEGLVRRMIEAMENSPLRDAVEGGFFRYSTQRNWGEPHYERMLYDNAQLLRIYSRASDRTAAGIASFLLDTLRLADGGFASAQDSESVVDGTRVEGGYYRLDAAARALQTPPGLDEKVLTGWNGLAIGALASAGARLGRPDWIAAAIVAAELVGTGELVRARVGDRISSARPTLEDYGMLSEGLIDLALATGEVRFAVRARELVAEALVDGGFAVPGGADPVLTTNGLVLENDPSEGAYPSGLSAMARAAIRLDQLGVTGLLETAIRVLETIAPAALSRPISFGSALGAMSTLSMPLRQLVVVTTDRDSPMARDAKVWLDGVGIAVTPAQAQAFAAAGFELFDGRVQVDGRETAYLCENFVCQLPVTNAEALAELLSRQG